MGPPRPPGGDDGGVTSSGDPVMAIGPERVRLDRPVLVGNLVSGALCLSPLAVLSWPLLAVGAVYVVAGSLFLAAVYGRKALTRRQEGLAWITPWLAAVGLWLWILMSIELGTPYADLATMYRDGFFAALLVATPLYLVWQLLALAARQCIAWQSGRSPFRSDSFKPPRR